MGASYRQFCPVAKAMELLDERWTLLVVRELVGGSERFNDLRRGLPRMSPTLLSKRLHTAGARRGGGAADDGNDVRYVLTAAGRELRPVVEALGVWGTRWIGELGDAGPRPEAAAVGHAPQRRPDGGAGRPHGRAVPRSPTCRPPAALVARGHPDGEADVCDVDPGHDVDVTVTATLHTLTEIWLGGSPGTSALPPATSR